MKRKIKCRGLGYEGIWYFGSIWKDKNDNYYIIDIDDERHLVIEETIGEFINVYDNLSKEIYEGDIIEQPNGGEFDWGTKNVVVLWSDITSGWATCYTTVNKENNSKQLHEDKIESGGLWRDYGEKLGVPFRKNMFMYQVVGNIYENLELTPIIFIK